MVESNNGPPAGPSTALSIGWGLADFDHATLNLMPNAVYVCNAVGLVVFYNKKAQEICGSTAGQGLALELFDFDEKPMLWEDTPVAQTIRTGVPRLGVVLGIEQEDGKKIRILADIGALSDPAGQTTGALVSFHEIETPKQENESLSVNDQELRAALEELPAAVYITDAAENVTYCNQLCIDLLGCTLEIGTHSWRVSWRLYWPKGTLIPHEERPAAVALSEIREVHGIEVMAERPDGRRVPCLAYSTLLRDHLAHVTGSINVLVDITARKHAEDHQQLVVHELNHRIKNTLATVLSIAAQSFHKDSDSLTYHWFGERIKALSKAHDVLARENWKAASLHDIVTQVTAPLLAQNSERFKITGQHVRVSTKMALSLAMTLHELCTNAAKYGALSNQSGTIAIDWNVQGHLHRTLHLTWREMDGPPVVVPKKKGFGSRLIERGLALELGGEVHLSYEPTGVVCEIKAPL